MSYEKFSEKAKIQGIISKLSQGKSIALVSDAGTPLISDPGAVLIEAARNALIDVVSLPGACAFITALSASGFSGPVRFIGFFPRSSKAALEEIRKIQHSADVLVFYESPRRIVTTLALFNEHLPSCRVCIGRELTKLHEEYITGDADSVISKLAKDEIRGEMTVIVKKMTEESEELPEITVMAKQLIEKGYSKRDTAKVLQDLYKAPKKDIYAMLLKDIL
jgi:16S rRNA (cytidine1402-2'-O)-methyltransferase